MRSTPSMIVPLAVMLATAADGIPYSPTDEERARLAKTMTFMVAAVPNFAHDHTYDKNVLCWCNLYFVALNSTKFCSFFAPFFTRFLKTRTWKLNFTRQNSSSTAAVSEDLQVAAQQQLQHWSSFTKATRLLVSCSPTRAVMKRLNMLSLH